MIAHWLDRVSGCSFWLSAAGICVVTLLITIDVVLRLLGHPILGSFEVTELILSVLVFASLAYTQREKGHIHVTMFVARLPLVPRLAVFGFMSVISTVVVAFVAYGAFSQAAKSVTTGGSTAVLEIPLYPFYLIEGIAMALFTVVLLLDTVRALAGMRSEALAHEVTKYWI